MHPDLQELEITKGDLIELTGIDIKKIGLDNIDKVMNDKLFITQTQKEFQESIKQNLTNLNEYQFFLKKAKKVITYSWICVFVLLGIPISIFVVWIIVSVIYSFTYDDTIALFFTLFCSIILLSFNIFLGIRFIKFGIRRLDKLDKKIPRSRFREEVRHHNQLVFNIDTLDQLAEVGNPVKLNEREKVVEALKINRNNLVRALKTEKILRENPKFRPEIFNIDLTGLKSLQATEKVTEYGRFLNEALRIGLSVQEEMKKIESKS